MTILVAVLAIGFLILIHELGHFLVARGVGMRVDIFSIGFGPALLTFHGKQTAYRLAMLPLGGYVRIAGMVPGDGTDPTDPASFVNRAAWQRFLVIFAGPFINWLFAFVLLSVLLTVGWPQISSEPVVGTVRQGSPAALVGLRPGDRVLAIGSARVGSWEEIEDALETAAGRQVQLQLARDGEIVTLTTSSGAGGRLGIQPVVRVLAYSFPGSVWVAFGHTGRVAAETLKGIVRMLRGESEVDLVGPVGVVNETARAARAGASSLFSILIFISVALALMNLLPLPALDGGRLVFIAVAMVRRRQIDPRVEAAVHGVGLLLLLGLVLWVTWGDIGDWIGRGAAAAPVQTSEQVAPKELPDAAPAPADASELPAADEQPDAAVP